MEAENVSNITHEKIVKIQAISHCSSAIGMVFLVMPIFFSWFELIQDESWVIKPFRVVAFVFLSTSLIFLFWAIKLREREKKEKGVDHE